MILSHFSRHPFTFDPNFSYLDKIKKAEAEGRIWNTTKPVGLWLSDESDYGWKQWCTENQWGTDTLIHETRFEIDLKQMLHLNSPSHFLFFEKMYANQKRSPIDYHYLAIPINWAMIQNEWAGILISPYDWDRRLSSHGNWYYGWDCSSACVWDLSVLKQIS